MAPIPAALVSFLVLVLVGVDIVDSDISCVKVQKTNVTTTTLITDVPVFWAPSNKGYRGLQITKTMTAQSQREINSNSIFVAA
jgi:hypothetical protein